MNIFEGIIDLGNKLNHLIIPKYLDNKIIIDAGSNIGNFIDKIRSIGIESNIAAIEPCKSNIDILNNRNLENVEIINKAMVGIGEIKTITFTEIDGLSEWGSVTDINTDRGLSKGRKTYRYPVEVVTLDDLITKYNEIDYLKMDIEGCETDVILTMNSYMASKVKQISMEIHNGDENKLEEKLNNIGYETLFKSGELFAIRRNAL
jgi:FkbM family methyltransferase